ncbi:MAG: sulfate permease [Lentilitoribacter sp.]
MPRISQYLPIFVWGRTYNKENFTNDLIAALIVTIMLIPQSLAYALLAGLPAEMGLYASIIPIVLYAIFGTSKALAVGPVAVVSLMTAAAIGKIADPGSPEHIMAAITLAFLSGAFLVLMGLLRLGFLANFLSHPVIAGFITASGILIATSQLKHIFGIEAQGHNFIELVMSLISNLNQINRYTFYVGLFVLVFLFFVRGSLKTILINSGISARTANICTKIGPVIAVIATIVGAWAFGLENYNVALVGDVPQGLPPLTTPSFSYEMWVSLIGSAMLISVIGFVESISVAQTLAAKKRQRVFPDQELIGLGAANIGASFSGGFPVAGGFSRSVVNFDAGADTPAAGAFTALGLAFASIFLTPLIFFLPKATLAATIIIAVLSLVDFSILKKTLNYSKADFIAILTTMTITLLLGIEMGVTAGVVISILIHLYKSSRPHMAVVGQVPGSEHYRNILRHDVITDPHILSVRVDESLYFANARFLEDAVYDLAVKKLDIKHVLLQCSAINTIDMSALESIEALNMRLKELDVTFHLTEVKGPVMDRLKRTNLFSELTGEVFLSQHCAVKKLRGESPSLKV